jgi:hypothetical protein
MNLDAQSTAPLDDLYTQILSVVPQEPQTLRVLHAVWRTTLPRSANLDPEEIDILLTLRPGTSRLVLRGLHSLFHVPPKRSQFGWSIVTVLHASLPDYLCNARRSGGWCISTPLLHSDYLNSMIGVLSSPPLTEDARTVCRYNKPLLVAPSILSICTVQSWYICQTSSGKHPPRML